MSEPVIALIAAMASNRVIGRENSLPWHLPEDLKFFKRTTLGKPLVMGRKTYESIGRPLPGRLNIVVSRQPGYAPPGVEVLPDLDAALVRGLQAARDSGAGEVMVIGGAQIYQRVLPRAVRLYLTEVQGDFDGDAYFPELCQNEWCELSRESGCSEAGLVYSFVVLERAE